MYYIIPLLKAFSYAHRFLIANDTKKAVVLINLNRSLHKHGIPLHVGF